MNKIIHTRYGDIEGFEHEGCRVYLGIPFAKPPVGELAFRHPLPPSPWAGVLKADKGSANPIQSSGGAHIGNNSLDCLYLNVFVPENAVSPLPVMVWIYGGSYSHGGAGAEEKGTAKLQYDLARFARKTGCAVVTFNYRLNIYGFLNLRFLDRSFDINNGLYDQIMALKFVRENISAFGGDPENVTVFGQSAGGACILALMSMKEAEGLFDKAIVQSACIEHFFTKKESLRNTRQYLKYAGVKKPSELKALDEKRICIANEKYSGWVLRHGDPRCAFSPVIDGVSLTDEPKRAVIDSHIPLLIGNTTQEANLFTKAVPSPALPFVARNLKVRVRKGLGSYRQRLSDALTRHIYIRPQLEILKEYKGKAWRYIYAHPLPGSGMGCFHASELPVLFDISLMGFEGHGDKTGDKLRAIWGRFAGKGTPGWKEGKTGIIK